MNHYDQNQLDSQLRHRHILLPIALLLGMAMLFSLVWGKGTPAAVRAQSPAGATTPMIAPASDLTVNLAIAQLKPGQQSTVTATLRDSAGQPITGQLVVFFGGLGSVTPASAVTDAEGRVNAVYTAGSRGGKAQVTVLAGYRAQSLPLQIESSRQPGGGYRLFLPAVAR